MNPNGRPTDDKKDSTVKVRLNSDMRNHVERQAERASKSMSEYIRDLIMADMHLQRI